VLAFTRGTDVLVAIPRFPFAGLDDDATVEVPAGRWRSVLADAEVDGSAKVPFALLRGTFPVAVLEHL
jgi:maltooligosyltrehalose synthase